LPRQLHVVFGTGPVGCWIARSLIAEGHAVRCANRSGKRPGLLPPEVELTSADITDASSARRIAEGATTIYQALNPEYHQWHEFFPALQAGALAGARASGARYVSVENLYMYDSTGPITEDARVGPRSKKGHLRQRMAEEVMAAHASGQVRATALRSSDYYGPGVLGSAMGEMVFGNLLAGKKAQVGGSLNQPHSFAYIEDVGRAAARLGTLDQNIEGRAWLAPHAGAETQGRMVELACAVMGVPKAVTAISPLMMRLAGLFIPAARESVEMMYEFTEPFVVDSRLSEATLGVQPTPVELGVARTVEWYRTRNQGSG